MRLPSFIVATVLVFGLGSFCDVRGTEIAVPSALPTSYFVEGTPVELISEGCLSTGCTATGSVSSFDGPILQRTKLAGSVFGVRDALAADGITFDISSTNFYQGVASGGLTRNFEYSGRDDYFVAVNGEKAGLWKGLLIDLHGETRYGNTVNGNTGALMPVNIGALFPLPAGTVTALTGVKFTQFLSKDFLVFAGKINMLDGLTQPYAAGRGVDAFMYTNLALPIGLARTVPYSTLGAGFAILHEMQPLFVFSVLDTQNSPTTSGFESLFSNGATMLGQLNVPVTLSGRPGHQGIGGSFSTGTFNNLDPTPYFDPTFGPGVTFGSTTGSWALFYMADQALYVDPVNPKRSWGLFSSASLADNGPSPVRWSLAVGLGGSSPIVSRPLDTFGVGYSYVGYTSPVEALAPVLSPIGADQAVEMFYNIAVTPWFRLTPDLQVVFPARDRTFPPGATSIDTALVLGLRAKIDF